MINLETDPSDPYPSDLDLSDLDPNDPDPIDPDPSDPDPSDHNSSDHNSSDPNSSDPDPSDPDLSDSEPNDPDPSDPDPNDPDPSGLNPGTLSSVTLTTFCSFCSLYFACIFTNIINFSIFSEELNQKVSAIFTQFKKQISKCPCISKHLPHVLSLRMAEKSVQKAHSFSQFPRNTLYYFYF